MKKLVLCVLAGAITAQLWGMISWMVLPWHYSSFKQFSSDRVVADAVTTEAVEAGIYLLPNFSAEAHKEGPEQDLFHTLMKEGPYAFMVVLPDGINPNMGKMAGTGFLLNLLFAFVLLSLVRMTSLKDDQHKTLFIAVVGSLGALHPLISQANWWFFPWGYALVGVVDYAIMWTLSGLVMVKLENKLS